MARMLAGQVAAAMEAAGMQCTVHSDLSVSGRWGTGYVRAFRMGTRGWALMNGADFNSSSRSAVAKTPEQVERFARPEFEAKPARVPAEVYFDGAETFELEPAGAR